MRTWCTLLALFAVLISVIECGKNRGVALGFGKRSDEEGLSFGPQWKRAPNKFNLGFGKRSGGKPKFALGFGKRSEMYEDLDDEPEPNDEYFDLSSDEALSFEKRSPSSHPSMKGLQKFNLGLGK
ncbi:unnamed protein product, partial [Mesorhabditis belari]|uniref:Uncharacterized protein n=1 Tax=Mesorhabditis belari TaxID=2138241 RepID=A0AAF3FPV2_9BILA